MPKTQKIESVFHDWVHGLPFQMQALLTTAMRGPDGCSKENSAKAIVRYLRGSVLKPAGNWNGENNNSFMWGDYDQFRGYKESFYDDHDALPHHFLMHLIHSAQVVACYHPKTIVRIEWNLFYQHACESFHMAPELYDEMSKRLDDFGEGYKEQQPSGKLSPAEGEKEDRVIVGRNWLVNFLYEIVGEAQMYPNHRDSICEAAADRIIDCVRIEPSRSNEPIKEVKSPYHIKSGFSATDSYPFYQIYQGETPVYPEGIYNVVEANKWVEMMNSKPSTPTKKVSEPASGAKTFQVELNRNHYPWEKGDVLTVEDRGAKDEWFVPEGGYVVGKEACEMFGTGKSQPSDVAQGEDELVMTDRHKAKAYEMLSTMKQKRIEEMALGIKSQSKKIADLKNDLAKSWNENNEWEKDYSGIEQGNISLKEEIAALKEQLEGMKAYAEAQCKFKNRWHTELSQKEEEYKILFKTYEEQKSELAELKGKGEVQWPDEESIKQYAHSWRNGFAPAAVRETVKWLKTRQNNKQ